MPRPQLNLRDFFWFTVVISLLLTLLLTRRSTPETPVTSGKPVTPGRYQLIVDGNGNSVIFDTATGESWIRYKNVVGPPIRSAPPWEE